MRDEKGRFTKNVAVQALPEKWCLRLATQEINDAVNSIKLWKGCMLAWYNSPNYTSYYIGYDGSYSPDLNRKDYKEITFDQFKKHVLNMEKKENKGKKIYSLEDLFHSNVVIYLDSKEEYDILKEALTKANLQAIYKNGGLCLWNGQHCYNLEIGQWSSSSSKTDPGYYKRATIVTLNQIDFTKRIYSLEELYGPNNLVYLNDKSEYDRLNKALDSVPGSKVFGKGLAYWAGPCCYCLASHTFSSTSSKTDVGGYREHSNIITFDQIDLKEEKKMKKITGYKLVKKEYVAASEKIMGVPYGSYQTYTVTVQSCIDSLRTAGVLDLWFEPIYEDEFKPGDWITIRSSYDLAPGCQGVDAGTYQVVADKSNNGLSDDSRGIIINFNGRLWRIDGTFRKATQSEIDSVSIFKIKGYEAKFEKNCVRFGCQRYTNDEILKFADILAKSGLKLKEYHYEVMQVAEYLRTRK